MKATLENHDSVRAFTVTELLALLCLLLIGFSVLTPTLARTRSNLQGVRCLENSEHRTFIGSRFTRSVDRPILTELTCVAASRQSAAPLRGE